MNLRRWWASEDSLLNILLLECPAGDGCWTCVLTDVCFARAYSVSQCALFFEA